MEEFLQMTVMDIDVSKQAKQVVQNTKKILEVGTSLIETVHRTKDGKIVHVEIGSRSIAYKGKQAILSTIRDITERKVLEEKMQALQEQEKHAVVGKVAGKMAHDFNNVLAVIMGTSQLLQTEDLPPEVKADIDTILESAEKGVALTRNLLVFAKDQEPKFSQFDINEKIELVIRSLKSELKDIEVTLTYGSSMEKLLADAGLLENAMVNLIQNTIHALSKTEKPKLSIKTYAENNSICIEIADNGCGIPAEYMDKLFEPTFTLKGSGDRTGAYRRDIKGSGYGLANVKQSVDKHGGTIGIESEVGKGTKFKITLPIIKGHFSTEEMEKIREYKIVKGKRILIVEDEIHLGRVLYSLLKKFDHIIDLAPDGKMALDHIKRNVYDAISLDYMLPDINGLEIYRKIRETNKEVPIIFVSGNFEFMQSMMDLKKEDPKVDHLAKPFNNVDYVNKIHEWLVD
jgi:signal transduction histidine kinase